jgi:hypothetical protein
MQTAPVGAESQIPYNKTQELHYDYKQCFFFFFGGGKLSGKNDRKKWY